MAYDLKEKTAYIKEKESAISIGPTTYKMPSGDVITLDNERHQAAEVLFNPLETLGRDLKSI